MNNVGMELIKSGQFYVIGIVGFIFIGGGICIGLLIIRDKVRTKLRKRGERK